MSEYFMLFRFLARACMLLVLMVGFAAVCVQPVFAGSSGEGMAFPEDLRSALPFILVVMGALIIGAGVWYYMGGDVPSRPDYRIPPGYFWRRVGRSLDRILKKLF